jgi:hypothetical protein
VPPSFLLYANEPLATDFLKWLDSSLIACTHNGVLEGCPPDSQGILYFLCDDQTLPSALRWRKLHIHCAWHGVNDYKRSVRSYSTDPTYGWM